MIWAALFLAVVALIFKLISRNLSFSAAKEGDKYRKESKEITVKVFSTIGRVAFIIALVFLILSPWAIIQAGHVGVATIFGSVRPGALHEGINLVNPFAVVHDMSVRTETYTMSAVTNEGQVKGDDAIQCLSSDGLLMPLDITIAYRLVTTDAPKVFRNIGEDYVDKVIRPASRTAVREAIAGFTAQEAYSTKREQLAQSMHETLANRLKQLLNQRVEFAGATGFVVDQVMIRNVQLPDKVKTAIEEKLEAEQASLKMKFVLEKERQEAERKRIEAQGIRDFQKIVLEGITPSLLEWKGIEATEQLAKSPNAKVVIIGGKNGLPVILNP